MSTVLVTLTIAIVMLWSSLSMPDAVVHGTRSSLQSPPETMHSARSNWRTTIPAIAEPPNAVPARASATVTTPTTAIQSTAA